MSLPSPQRLLDLLDIEQPIIQAPMAGISTPAMAAAVSNAGGLGSIGVGATSAAAAGEMIAAVRALSNRSLNVNLFCHQPARADAAREAAWLERLRPEFDRVGAEPPAVLREIYQSFVEDKDMLATLLAARPKVVSFHFGMPPPDWIRAMREAGIVLLGSATNPDEARLAASAGVHAVVAQGYEAGGHRGMFDPDGEDTQLGTIALTRLLVRELDVPVIAAGGIMDGAGIAAVLRIGAGAAQLGTAFVATDKSAADGGYRAALFSEAAHRTVMTRAISGRPARCLANRFTAFGAGVMPDDVPSYPIAYDAGKALHAAAKATGDFGYGAQWAGQGAPLARSVPAGSLMADLIAEFLKAFEPEELDMGGAQIRSETATEAPRARGADMKLEAVVIPVADVERAKRFYADLGWRLDADFPFDNGFRVVQFTPPGSACSIQFGTNITSAAPGSAQGLYLIVSEIQAARDELVARGVEISEVFHPGTPGAQFQPDGTSGRVSGPSPIARATAPSPRSATRTAMAGCCRRLPFDCPDAWMPTTRHSPRRLSSRQRSGAPQPRTASTRSGPASTMRTGRTGMPSTSSGNRPASRCRRDRRLARVTGSCSWRRPPLACEIAIWHAYGRGHNQGTTA